MGRRSGGPPPEIRMLLSIFCENSLLKRQGPSSCHSEAPDSPRLEDIDSVNSAIEFFSAGLRLLLGAQCGVTAGLGWLLLRVWVWNVVPASRHASWNHCLKGFEYHLHSMAQDKYASCCCFAFARGTDITQAGPVHVCFSYAFAARGSANCGSTVYMCVIRLQLAFVSLCFAVWGSRFPG